MTGFTQRLMPNQKHSGVQYAIFFGQNSMYTIRLQIHLPSFVFNMYVVPNKSSPYTT